MTINVTLTKINNLQDTTSSQNVINNNNTSITTGFSTAINSGGDIMLGNLDMNSNRVLNLPLPQTLDEPLRLQDLSSFIGQGTINLLPAGGTTGQVLSKNSNTNYDVGWSTFSLTNVAFLNATSPFTVNQTFPTIFVNANSGSLPTPQTGSVIQFASANGTVSSAIEGDAAANPVRFRGLRSEGTLASPTALATGSEISSFNGGGFTGSAWVSGSAGFRTFAAPTGSTWTITDTGSYSDVIATPAGTTSSVEVASFNATSSSASNITIGTAGSIVGSLELANATSGTVSLTPTTGALGSAVITVPAATDTMALIAATQTLTNKTISGATISGGTISGVTSASLTLGSDATGDIYYRNSGGNLARLGIGTSGFVLTVSGGLPAWVTAGTASNVTIASTTVSSGTSGDILYDNAGVLGNLAVIDNSGGSATVSSPNLVLSTPGGFRNVIRNGTFDVWQRGTSLTISGSQYVADGWIVNPSGASSTVQQASNNRTGAYTLYGMQIAGNTSMTDIQAVQRIEGIVAAKLAGKTVTFQAQIFNNTGGSITPTLTTKYAGSLDNWSAPSTDLAATNLQACANGAWTQVSYTLSVSSNATAGYEFIIDFGNNFSTTGKTVILSEVDVRVTPGVSTGLNSSPPIPEIRNIATELHFCRRYFQSFGGTNNYVLGTATFASTTAAYLPIIFQGTMRAAPTMAATSASAILLASNTNITASANAFTDISTTSCLNTLTLTGGTAGNAGLALISSSVNTITASAEL